MVAHSPDDLRFFFEAQSRGAAIHPGSVFTNHWTVEVQEWENVADRPPAWRVWAADVLRPGQAPTVKELITGGGRGAYLVFVRDPTKRAVTAIEDCLRPVYGRRGKPIRS
jgi:hypothetical protein